MTHCHSDSVVIPVEWVTKESFAPFGDVIELPAPQITTGATSVNQGTATKHHYVAQIVNLRPGDQARPNLSLFVCQPRNSDTGDSGQLSTQAQLLPLKVKLLERHPHSSQMFLPMLSQQQQQQQNPTRYLVIVAKEDSSHDCRPPDLSTVRGFLFRGCQGVNYRPGCWHHPMIALDTVTTFTVLTHEDGTDGDCEEWYLHQNGAKDLYVEIPQTDLPINKP